MAESSTVELHLVAGDPITGVWCDHCLLPSAITVPVTIHTPDGNLVGEAGIVTRCLDCDDWLTADNDEGS